ncbi:hypothetical protein E4634_16160 [Mangrovimicrobium sediminis]|uniref:Uncharacterized protein n=1 Tax=Mangrovimicrobium sediminis TaxID=2562682 RepID=A0A4Z0LY78_9GAMM|nr:BPSL0067 family protein [Haliea sp. SAOS-164]TGD72200.1 hypothetical protein E4634_16160 [Haliea sp. SAOS-164]
MEKIDTYSDSEWFILMDVDSGVCQSFSVPAIRKEWVKVEGPFESKGNAEKMLSEICIEFRARLYLKDEYRIKHLQVERRSSHRADLAICQSYEGERLSSETGWDQYIGECATGVQYVCHQSNDPIGRTSEWKKGQAVRGNSVPAGTAIASFRNDVYADDHAAILIAERSEGLEVWDQFNNPQKPWGKRILGFDYSGKHPYSNDGDLFSVILS